MLTIDVVDDNAAENWSAATMIEETRAAIRALNKTAREAAADIRADLPSRFIIRSAWTRKGIRFDRATMDNPMARVYRLMTICGSRKLASSINPMATLLSHPQQDRRPNP